MARIKWGLWPLRLIVGLGVLSWQGVAIANEILLESKAEDHLGSPATTVAEWRQPIAQANPIMITGIQWEATEAGLRLQLETDGELEAPEISIADNSAIADISNAVLKLPENETFFVGDPTADIASINVVNLPDNRVQIIITGINIPPRVSIEGTTTSLVLNATPGDATVQTPGDAAIEIIATGEEENNRGFFVPNTSTATRTNTAILDTPASVVVISERVLEEQQAVNLEQALENVSGISVNGGEGRGPQISLRGFDGVPVFRDGFRVYSPKGKDVRTTADLSNIERIEVLRGAASALFGQIEPGGIVNLISKQPQAIPSQTISFQAGSYGFLRPQMDFTGPLTEDGSLLYRLVATYEYEDGFRKYDEDVDRLFIAPSVTARIGDRTDLNLQLEYLNDRRPLDPGLVAFGDGIADIPRDRILGEPDDTITNEFLSVGYNLEHRFSENWTLRNAFRYSQDNDDIRATLSFPFIGGLNETTGVLSRVFAEQVDKNETLALQTNVVGEFSTGPIDHTLLMGVDLAWFDLNTDSFTVFFPPSVRVPINIFDPIYGSRPRPIRPSTPVSSETINTNSVQLYVQDQIELIDNLTLMAGFNYEIFDQSISSTRGLVTTNSSQNGNALSPRVGLVYKPLENLSLYTSYAQSFFPNVAFTILGDTLDPEQGEGFEVGVTANTVQTRHKSGNMRKLNQRG